MNSSPRLSLPYIAPAQAQKHITYNEAIHQLDMVVQLSLEATQATTPPAVPQNGLIYALGAAPTGAWAGNAETLAMWSENAWSFTVPQAGWRAWDTPANMLRVWDGSAWAPVTSDIGTPDSIGINTAADTVNRLALASEASLFTHDGAGHQIKVNKAGAGDTASLLYQTGFSGRAEMGLAGNNDFAIKVSADGNAWTDAVVIDATSGNVGFGTASPGHNLHVSGATSYLALEDHNGVMGGAMSAAIRLFAGGTEHGQLGFPGTTTGTMHLRNFQGDLNIEADALNRQTNSLIRFAVDSYEMMRVRPTGVGIGTLSPVRSLHVGDVMRLEPSPTPSGPAAGDIYFDAATSKLRCHDGTTWRDLF